MKFGDDIDPIALEVSVKNAAGKKVRYRLLDSPKPPVWLKLSDDVLGGRLPIEEGPGPRSYEAQVVAELADGSAVSSPQAIRITGTCPKPIHRERSNARECGVSHYHEGKHDSCGFSDEELTFDSSCTTYYRSDLTVHSVSCSISFSDGLPGTGDRFLSALAQPYQDLICLRRGFECGHCLYGSGSGGPDATPTTSSCTGHCANRKSCEHPSFGVQQYFSCALPSFELERCEQADGIPLPLYQFATELGGTTYQTIELARAEAEPRVCRDHCIRDLRCKGFTYVVPGAEAVNPRCHLKENLQGSVAATSKVSGVVRTSDPGGELEWYTNRPGRDIQQGFALPHADPTLCRKACQDNPICRAFTYVRPALGQPPVCWLKNDVPAPAITEDTWSCVSGIVSR